MLPLLAALLLPAHAEEPSARIDASLGLITGQLGFGLAAGGGLHHGGFTAFGSVGGAVRGGFLSTAIDAPLFPLAGLGTLGLQYTFAISDNVRLGPVAQANAAVLAASERDCGNGDGCRHALWLGGDAGVGVSYAPSAGLALEAGLGRGHRLDASLGVQPTTIYDIALPFAPRIDATWTAPSGLRIGLLADRYGARTTFGLSL